MANILVIILIKGETSMNWFLFRVAERFTDEDGKLHEVGDKGVGMCSMEPGIMEAPRGIMYVAPQKWIEDYHIERGQGRYCVSLVEDAISAYYGVRL